MAKKKIDQARLNNILRIIVFVLLFLSVIIGAILHLKKKKKKGVNYDYISEPKIFHFKKDNLINVQNVILKNNGNMVWKKGFKFILVKKYSNYYGNDFDFLKDVNPGDSINIELAFDECIGSEQNEYFCSYKLIDEESNQIGNIQKFEIKMI